MQQSTFIPPLDLKAQYAALRAELDGAIQEVLDTTAFVGGPAVDAFERDFARYCGVEHTIGVANGTDALHLALRALGVGPGDAVVTAPNTFIATVSAICMAGATPVFCDVDGQSRNMDPERLADTLARPIERDGQALRPRAILPVHLWGQPAWMTDILDVAAKHGLPVIEDAAQAHGAKYDGKRCGSFGVAGCFSFYPGKNLGAYGDAGAITTDDTALVEKIRLLQNHGRRTHLEHVCIGWNSRLDGLQGAVLGVKLRHLERWNELRRSHAAAYTHLLANDDRIVTPPEVAGTEPVFHQYVVEVPARDAVLAFLKEEGIGGGIHYPIPVHLQPAYAWLGLARGSFPVAEQMADRILSLPMYPELAPDDIERIAATLTRALDACA